MDESGFVTAYGHSTFADMVGYVVGWLNQIVGVLAAAALLLFMWGAFQYVYKQGKAKQRTTMLWSLLALFILFSIWGILRVMCNSFLGESSCGGSTGAPLNIVPSGAAGTTGTTQF